MDAFLVPYSSALAGYVGLGALYLVQAVAADVIGIRAGHVPGMSVTGGHDDLLFRATRAQANTNENLGIFLVLSMAAILLGASAWWTSALVWTFVLSRLVHMLAYYSDLRTLRSVSFGVGLLCLMGLLVDATAALR